MPRRCARNSMSSINQACGRMFARRTGTRRTPVSARMLAASAALLRVRANNYSPLPPLRPTAAPRRAGHTHPPSPPRTRGGSGGSSGHAPLRAASARARARHPGGRPDAHAIQRTSPVSPRTTRRIRARAPSDRAGRAHDGRLAGGGYR
jgi:hypothetical protein